MFQAPMGKLHNAVCTECGHIPTLDHEVLTEAAEPVASEISPSSAPAKPASRKRRRSHLIIKFILGWCCFIGLIIYAGKILKESSVADVARISAEEVAQTQGEIELAFIDRVRPQAIANLSGFIAATAPEQQNQFVHNPVLTATKTAAFYSLNPLVRLEASQLRNTANAMLTLPMGAALESTWTSTDGYQMDAVFLEEGNEWRLDWDHFIRYSDYPWPLFIAGSGPDVGNFRLLARERLADERKTADEISLVFYAPRFGDPKATGPQSPEFLISRASEEGRLLEAAFAQEKAGKRVFGVKLPSENSEGLIRVRIRVRRSESENGRKFTIEKILACHWYSESSVGITLPEKKP